jgi:hypothetical protein
MAQLLVDGSDFGGHRKCSSSLLEKAGIREDHHLGGGGVA